MLDKQKTILELKEEEERLVQCLLEGEAHLTGRVMSDQLAEVRAKLEQLQPLIITPGC